MTTKLILISVAILTWTTIEGCKKELEPTDLVPKTVENNPSLPSIYVNNTQLHSETFGNPDSPMIVILHGGPGADYRSLLNCKDLANDGYYVVFYDQRGSGLSKRHDKSIYNIQIMLDDLSAVIDHYRTSPNQKVFLFGHSWGAILATAFVNKYSTVISGLILAEPGGFTWKDTRDYVERTHQLNLFSEETNDAFYDGQIFTGKEDEHEILDYNFALTAAHEYAKGNAVGNAGPVPFWRSGAIVSKAMFEIADRDGFDFTTNLGNYETKVLFCYSELNTAYGFDHARLVSSAYHDVQLELINNSGHEMIYFGWNNLRPIVLTYLNTLK